MSNGRYSLNLLDYVLAFIGSGSALISVGHALNAPEAGYFFCGLVFIGLIVSYSLRVRTPSELRKFTIDGVLFLLSSIVVLVFLQTFNQLQPGGGFAGNLIQNSFLAWMMVFGSFLAWRDSTLLFQAVPAIALFGLVGAYDTYRYAPFLFFVFLLCAAGLFARSNLRRALERTEQEHKRTLDQLQKYEWQTLAGPEWALGSALVVIAMSVLGAPVIQNGVRAAAIPLTGIEPPAPAPSVASGANPMSVISDNVRIGQGPIDRPSDMPMLSLRMEDPTYLRGRSFLNFERNRWRNSEVKGKFLPETGRQDFGAAILSLSRDTKVTEEMKEFDIRLMHNAVKTLYLPVTARQFAWRGGRVIAGSDDSISTFPPPTRGDRYRGLYQDIDYSDKSDTVGMDPMGEAGDQPLLLAFTSTPIVKSIAETVVKGAKTDREKLDRIQAYVSETVKYNLQAPACPDGTDAIEFVLTQSKQAYCDVFASAVAQMGRAVGIPTRVSAGFLVFPNDKMEGYYVIRDRYYHLWAEAYFPGTGWEIFDATEGAVEVQGNGRGALWLEPNFFTSKGPWLIGFGLIALVASGWAFFKFLLPLMRAKLAASLAAKKAIELARNPLKELSYRSMVRVMRQIARLHGRPRNYDQTISEYLREVESTSGVAGDELASILNRLLYSQAEISASLPNDIREVGEAFVAQLKVAKEAA